ncbi:MAG TPA: AAA family ATPase, partial [Aminivibrio sp.]|nr:AAA family ATPase [Aminivibrio sp.]
IVNSLLRGFIKAEGKAPAGFLLFGDAGIGKTRILAQFMEKIRQFPGNPPVILLARAKKFGPAPFSLINELLLSYLHAQQRTSGRSMEDELLAGLGLDAETVSRFLSLLAGGALPDDESGSFVVLYLILVAILRKHRESPYAPLLAIDNCHNIDPQSLDFFRFFLKSTEIHPFLLLAGRNENRVIQDVFASLSVIDVPPLGAGESHELFKALWEEEEAQGMEEKILEYAAGNPLFIEEYVKYAEEHADIGLLPDTIQNIYLSAIEKLESGTRDILRKVSVFIHNFTFDDAAYIEEHTEGDVGTLGERLERLVGERYLYKENGFFHFKSDAMKRALYNALLNHNKKILHRLVSERLKGQKAPNILRLIHHLIRAEEYTEAGEALVRDPGYIQKMEYLPYLDSLIAHARGKSDSDFFRFMFTKSGILFNNGKKGESEEVL